jgi:hypothetical protein
MEQPQPPQEPITYVGGLGEPPKRRAWPYLALGLIPVLLVVGVIVFWNPIRSIGRSAGQTLAPYSLTLLDVNWSSHEKIRGVPNTLTIVFENADQRTADGITMNFTRLDQGWQILAAGSGNAVAQTKGKSIFFPPKVAPGARVAVAVTLLPTKAMSSEIDVTIAPDHVSSAARFDVGGGTLLTTLQLPANVREPRESDANARLTALYSPLMSTEEGTFWEIHVANTGPITINNVRLSFPTIPDGFEIRPAASQGVVLPDGQTLEYHISLPPGGQSILVMGVVSHETGHFQIPIYVFLGGSTAPLSAANGGPPLSVDVTVS